MAMENARPGCELSKVIARFKGELFAHHPTQIKFSNVLKALEECRTSALGSHVDACDTCGHQRISYNSCRNRHCPKCQSTQRERWILARQEDLLPCKYFHVVFTLPEGLNRYCLEDPRYFYDALLRCSRDTLLSLSEDERYLGAQPGMVAVLHTWGQSLQLHPHAHLIVTAGGLSEGGQWRKTRSLGHYLFPGKIMSVLFRAKFMASWLEWHKQKGRTPDVAMRRSLYDQTWVVYAKLPFGGPEQVIEYLGRYSHKVAITNHRIQEINETHVRFRYKDYRDKGKTKEMSLSGGEFLRRFCLHILPRGFRKIRHYGILASRNKPRLKVFQFIKGIQRKGKAKADWKEICRTKLNFDPEKCPCCNEGKMIRKEHTARAPPTSYTLPARL